MRPGVRYGIAKPHSRVSLIQPAGAARPPARNGGACVAPPPPGDAEGIVGLPATWSERSAQSRSPAEEIVTKLPVAGNDLRYRHWGGGLRGDRVTTTAREVDGHDRLKARACKLALTLLVISGRQVVDLPSGCDRLAWFDVVRRLRRVPIFA